MLSWKGVVVIVCGLSIQSSNIVSTCWNKLWWCRPFTACLNSSEKCNSYINPAETLFVLLSKYSNEKPSLCERIGQFLNHFLIVNEGLQGSLPRLEGQWRRPVWTVKGGREGEGACCGDTVTERTPKPHQPPPTWSTKCWSGQLRAAVTSPRDFNEGLAAALGLWWACVARRLPSEEQILGQLIWRVKGGSLVFKDVQQQ